MGDKVILAMGQLKPDRTRELINGSAYFFVDDAEKMAALGTLRAQSDNPRTRSLAEETKDLSAEEITSGCGRADVPPGPW